MAELAHAQEPKHESAVKALLPFLFRSLLSRDGYTASSRHRIILVSSHFSTFVSFVQDHLKVSNILSSFSLLNPGRSGAKPEP